LNDTKAEVAEAVLRLTGMALEVEHFDEIGEKLAVLVEKSDPLK
jgi:hypothetical protein